MKKHYHDSVFSYKIFATREGIFMDINIAIPCAGLGTRLRPYTNIVPKCLLNLGHTNPLRHKLGWISKLKHKKIIIITREEHKKLIINDISDYQSSNIEIVIQKNTRDLLGAVIDTGEYKSNYTMVILGDEIYINSNHNAMIDYFHSKDNLSICCGYITTNNNEIIKNNFRMEIFNERVLEIEEKPKHISNNICGVGTWIIDNDFYGFAKRSESKDINSVIQEMIISQKKVYSFNLMCNYVNINTEKDLIRAKNLLNSV